MVCAATMQRKAHLKDLDNKLHGDTRAVWLDSAQRWKLPCPISFG